MSVKTKLRPLSVKEYLEGELKSDKKHDLISGQVYAMAGASRHRVLLTATLIRLLGNRLTGSPCRAYMSDMRSASATTFITPTYWFPAPQTPRLL